MGIRAAAILAIAVTAVASACGEGRDADAGEGALAKRGRAVYAANCTACHAPDPSREGGLGPAVAGASLELLEARVLRGEYPPGYEPKSGTGVMPPMPYLEQDLAALHAFLSKAAADRSD